MRKQILLPLLLMGVIVFFLSCKKESRDNLVTSEADETINVRIASNQSYETDVTNSGTVSILKQAIHFSVSETMVNEIGRQVYKYIPVKDFTGNDEVLLLSNNSAESHSVSNSGGCPGSSNAYTTSTGTKYTTIKITVGN